MNIKWWLLEGDRAAIYGSRGQRVFKVHIGPGRIWWAAELAKDMTPLRAAGVFDGPQSARRAHRWCEEQLKHRRPRRRRTDWPGRE